MFKRKLWKRLTAFSMAGILAAALFVIPGESVQAAPKQEEKKVKDTDKTLKLWYDEPARITGIDQKDLYVDQGFEEESLPLGCGFMGANVWGGTEQEVIYITENSLANPYTSNTKQITNTKGTSNRGGLNLLAKTWIDFGHNDVTNYSRDLILDDATAHVSYDCDGVHYKREYFTSYPDKVMAVKLSASEKGKLNFTLHPEAPFLGDYLEKPNDGMGKTGKVTASKDGVITLSGTMKYYQINYEGQYKVIPTGGTMTASNDENADNGKIEVKNADSAVILFAAGTNYVMKPETFTETDNKKKLDPNSYPHEKVSGYLKDAEAKGYDALRERHVADYQKYYSRVNLDLGGQVSNKTTDTLLAEWKKGTYSPYLEEVFFQYGRYLLIASSRKGCLPANLQGIWNAYEETAWSGGYWHNINVQMNYWPAFVGNLPEMFESYADLNEAFRKAAEANADKYLTDTGSSLKALDGTGENGWAIGTGVWPYRAEAPAAGGHSGPGTGAFTSMLFWDWYDFTRDQAVLEDHTYPAVAGMAKFLSKSLVEQDDLLLISPSASPENAKKMQTVGCAFDQQMTWENHADLLKTAELLGKQDEIVQTAKEQIDRLDPVNIGYDGQVKEYREEKYYGEFGEPDHRHISQLVGLYPGTSINQNTDAWMDAAKISLEKRGLGSTGWSIAHRLCAWARVGDGEKCYQEIQKLLKEKIMNNLWDTHQPFQIDGNFGATAGIGEMLLQSHAGYIAPLPALPSAWKTGSYEGLLARGNFAVSAAWKDGKAASFDIKSQAGGSCSVKYPGLADAVVTDGAGKKVTVSKAENDIDRITFDTVKGETYHIAQIAAVEKAEAPENLKLATEENGIKLQWKGTADAEYYRVYAAVNDAPKYELEADEVDATQYLFQPKRAANTMKAEDRVTLRVTAVGADGRESEGVTVQILPVEAPEKVSGTFVESTDEKTNLRLSISETAGAEGYAVYEKDGDEWKKLYDTKTATAYVKDAKRTAQYAVASIGQGRESEKTAVVIEDGILENVLFDKPVSMISSQKVNVNFPLKNVVNGKADPTIASDRVGLDGDAAGFWTMEVDLEGTYELKTLSIVEWRNGESKTRSQSTKVEALVDGKLVTIQEKFPLEWGGTRTVDMKGTKASKLQFTFDNQGDPKKYASITEIMCSAKEPQQADKTDLFYALQEIKDEDLSQYILRPGIVALQKAQKSGIALMNDASAKEEKVKTAVENLERAIEEFQKITPEGNILRGQKIETDAPSTDSTRYPVEAMVDGDTESRYAGEDTEKTLTATITLDGIYRMDSFLVQEYVNVNGGTTRGGETTIEVLLPDGITWQKVVDKKPLKGKLDKEKETQSTTEFELEKPVEGTAVRFHFENTNNETERITVHELQAVGQRLPSVLKVKDCGIVSVKEGTEAAELVLPETVKVTLDNGTSAELPVVWNTDNYKTQHGKYTLTGTVTVGDDIRNPENKEASVQVIVWSEAWDYLETVIETAGEKKQDAYTAESWSSMQVALTEAKEFLVQKDADTGSDAIKAMAENLKSAINALQEKGDKAALNEVLEKTEAVEDEKYYTADSWKSYQKALKAAQDVQADPNAVQDAVDQAVQALQKALEGMELSTAELDALLAQTEELKEDDYTPESWKTMLTKRNEAMALLASPDQTGAAIEAAAKALQEAIDGLQPVTDDGKGDGTGDGTGNGTGSGTGDEGSGTGNEGGGTGNEGSGAGNTGNGTGNEGSGAGNEGSGAGNEGSGAGNEGSGTGNEGNGAGNTSSTGNVSGTDNTAKSAQDVNRAPGTGDAENIIAMFGFMGIAFVTIAMIIWKRRRAMNR